MRLERTYWLSFSQKIPSRIASYSHEAAALPLAVASALKLARSSSVRANRRRYSYTHVSDLVKEVQPPDKGNPLGALRGSIHCDLADAATGDADAATLGRERRSACPPRQCLWEFRDAGPNARQGSFPSPPHGPTPARPT